MLFWSDHTGSGPQSACLSKTNRTFPRT